MGGGSTRSLRVAGLFAGIGGIELGMRRAGHEAALLCEFDAAAAAVLQARFRDVPLVADVRDLDRLPAGVDLVTAGFPCQDLSQAGATRGIDGTRSGLVGEVFRLIEAERTPFVLLENVPFMLRLGRGAAMERIVDRFEELGYRWAYRVLDTQAFGLPQRRERVFFLASRNEDPAPYLFRGNHTPNPPCDHEGEACGFYWTEGLRGLGWAVSAVPTLKGGSTVGIPSPPALWLPDGRFVTPDIRDAERLQGFPQNWTAPAERAVRASFRWRLVGNAVTVRVAQWVGERLASPVPDQGDGAAAWAARPGGEPLRTPWPKAAFGGGPEGRYQVALSTWPVRRQAAPISEFLSHVPRPLSLRAAAGFLKRFQASSLRAPEAFRSDLESYVESLEAAAGPN